VAITKSVLGYSIGDHY